MVNTDTFQIYAKSEELAQNTSVLKMCFIVEAFFCSLSLSLTKHLPIYIYLDKIASVEQIHKHIQSCLNILLSLIEKKMTQIFIIILTKLGI